MVYLISYDRSFSKAGTLILVSPVASTEDKNVLIMEWMNERTNEWALSFIKKNMVGPNYKNNFIIILTTSKLLWKFFSWIYLYLTCVVYLHPELCTNSHSKSCPAGYLYDQKGPIKEWVGQLGTGAGVPNTELRPSSVRGKLHQPLRDYTECKCGPP